MLKFVVSLALLASFSTSAYEGECDDLQKQLSASFQNGSTKVLVFNDTISYITSNGNYFYHCQDKARFDGFKKEASKKNLKLITVDRNIEADFPLICYKNCSEISLEGKSVHVSCESYECSIKNVHQRTLAIYRGANLAPNAEVGSTINTKHQGSSNQR